MAVLEVIHLEKSNMGVPAKVVEPAEARGRRAQGVTALFVEHAGSRWCLVADSPQNKGVSATNGFREYAKAACAALPSTAAGARTPGQFNWFELDSTGGFDEVDLSSGVTFRPLKHPGTDARSLSAFLGRTSPCPPQVLELIELQAKALKTPSTKNY